MLIILGENQQKAYKKQFQHCHLQDNDFTNNTKNFTFISIMSKESLKRTVNKPASF